MGKGKNFVLIKQEGKATTKSLMSIVLSSTMVFDTLTTLHTHKKPFAHKITLLGLDTRLQSNGIMMLFLDSPHIVHKGIFYRPRKVHMR